MRPAALQAVLLILVASVPASARPLREVTTVRTDRAPVIDGRIEAEIWSRAPEITALEQQRPDNGSASSETTHVWILYDEDALYVAARLSDRKPVTRLLGRRDTFLESDWFGVLLDPQRDRRSGNAFFVNPDGVQYDEVISNDVEEDTSWDGVWQSATSIDPGGWSAEMRIPFSQLRFPEREAQTWGLNFIRWIKRRQEQARLVSHPRNEPGFASRFGDLVGLQGIRPRPRIEVSPYFTSGLAASRTTLHDDPLNPRTQGEVNGGLDLRWTTRSNLTIGATVNPDFGQVEVDPAILELSQFEQFFPEKRPFFLEGAKLYTFGELAASYPSPFRLAAPILFYSRRIGRVPQGNTRLAAQWVDTPDETSIRGASKLVYRTNGGTSVALLDAITGAERAELRDLGGPTRKRIVEPLTNSVAGRWTRDLGPRARMGALLTGVHRRGGSETAFLPSRAVVSGLDAYGWFGDRQVLVDAVAVGSHIAGSPEAITLLQRSPAHQFQRPDASHLDLDPSRRSLSGWGSKLTVSREKGMWRWQAQAESYSPGFEVNDLGFHSRADVRAANVTATWFDVAQRRLTRNNRVTLGRYGTWTQGDERIGNGVGGDVATTFRNYWSIALQGAWLLSALDDREARGGPAIPRAEGWSALARLASDPRKPLAAEVTQSLGADDAGGRVRVTRVGLTVRPRSNLSTSLVATASTNVIGTKWVSTVADPAAAGGARYVFGRLADRRIEIAPRMDWTIKTNLTFQLYLQPFAASGTYQDLKELLAAGGGYATYGQGMSTVERSEGPREYRIDPDGSGPAAPFTVRDPDFTLRSLRGNAVVRWEVNGATTLYLVWNQQRSARNLVTSESRFDDLAGIGDVPADDRVLLKVSHRFDLPR